MKKIIGIIFASLLFSNIGYAEIRQIEVKNIKGNYNPEIIYEDIFNRNYKTKKIAKKEKDSFIKKKFKSLFE